MPNPGKKTPNPIEKLQQGKKPPSGTGKNSSSGKGRKPPSQSGEDGFITVGGRKWDKPRQQKAAAAEQPDSGGKAAKSAAAAKVRPNTQDPKTSQGENSSSSDEEADDDSDSQSRQVNDHDNDSSDEEGQLSEAESRGVAGDILGAHVEEGAFGGSRLQKGSNLEKFVLRELETAVREGSNPHPVVLQLALGTSALHPGIAQNVETPDDSGPANTTTCVFERNSAEDGGKEPSTRSSVGSGGAYLHSGLLVSLADTTFVGNRAGAAGLAVSSLGIIENLTDTTFESNTYYCQSGQYDIGADEDEVSGTYRFDEVCTCCAVSNAEIPESMVVANNAFVPICETIMKGASGNAGATVAALELDPDYYRTSADSREVLQCHQEEACMGGVETSEYCASGYEGAFSSVVNVVYPDVYEKSPVHSEPGKLQLWFHLVGLCVVDSNYYGRLLFATIGPLVVLAALALTYAVSRSRNRHSPAGTQTAKHKHLSIALFIMFVVYSWVSFNIFQTFVCETLDDGVEYLRADYSLLCSTDTHTAMKLVSNRHDLVKVDANGGSTATAKSLGNLQSMRDLWAPYKPRRYYFEVVECGRLIALTGLAGFIYPGSAAQVALEVVFAAFFIGISDALSPFADPLDAWLYRSGAWVIFISIQSQELFAKLLISAHVGMVLAIAVQAVLSVKGSLVVMRDQPIPIQGFRLSSLAEVCDWESNAGIKGAAP
ncbi:unnamed protein product [Ectocarpus sp. CCAP 1310/34]|nr:unnamed protein product [Ectocarpus sp. CCAP 1310/34]